MGSVKLFVGGLSWNTTNETLRGAFERFGEVTEAKVVMDRDTGRSRGFGFVAFKNEDGAAEAKVRMDGADLDGRSIRVNEAENKGPRGYNTPRPTSPAQPPTTSHRPYRDRDGRPYGDSAAPLPEPAAEVETKAEKPRGRPPEAEFVDRSDREALATRGSRDFGPDRPPGGARTVRRPPNRGPRSFTDD
jgi:RNA recognition motif-containing protein